METEYALSDAGKAEIKAELKSLKSKFPQHKQHQL